jgi:hypothetical protein
MMSRWWAWFLARTSRQHGAQSIKASTIKALSILECTYHQTRPFPKNQESYLREGNPLKTILHKNEMQSLLLL